MAYTPLFDTLTTGTLYGKWPDIGLWPVILSMADRNGIVDVTPQFIAGVTGLELREVIACMKRFEGPDLDSRSQNDDGARLELVDPKRKWGWRIVNYVAYRERARMAAKNSEATASGMDAERKRRAREAAKGQECPPMSADGRLSDGDGDGDIDSKSHAHESESVPECPPMSAEMPVRGLNRDVWTGYVAHRIALGLNPPGNPQGIRRLQEWLAGFSHVTQLAILDQAIAAGEGLLRPLAVPPPAAEAEIYAEWSATKPLYPAFTGRQDWIVAERTACRLVAEGLATWEDLRAGFRRYAAYVSAGGVSDSRYVLTPGKFLTAEDQPWAQDWAPPQAAQSGALTHVLGQMSGWKPPELRDPPEA